jgi:predicted DsbA family dithiol-disulfide isomerase
MPGAKKPVSKKGSVEKTFDPKKLQPKMTKQDAAMKKLLEKKYGKIYG